MGIPDFLSAHLSDIHDLSVISENILGLDSHIDELKEDLSKKEKRMILISGLSGSGKDTIMEKLRQENSRIQRVRTCTTRRRRPEESELDDPYVRIAYEEFQEKVRKGDVLEFVEYAGNYYCTSQSLIDEVMQAGMIPMLRVDPVGARSFMNMWREKRSVFNKTSLFYFFIIPETFEELRERLINRGDEARVIAERMEQSMKDVTLVGETQYIVVNRKGRLDEAVRDILAILSESWRTEIS